MSCLLSCIVQVTYFTTFFLQAIKLCPRELALVMEVRLVEQVRSQQVHVFLSSCKKGLLVAIKSASLREML